MSSAILVFAARVLLLVLLYLFLYVVIRALRRDLSMTVRAQQASPAAVQAPSVAPAPAVATTLGLEVLEAGQTTLPPGQRFPLRDPFTIGRSAASDMTLEDDWVSSQHVRLHRQKSRWLAEDMGSTNGTRINGRPVQGAVRIRPGDVLDLGRVKLKLVEQGP